MKLRAGSLNTNQIDKLLARLIKKDPQNKIRNER